MNALTGLMAADWTVPLENMNTSKTSSVAISHSSAIPSTRAETRTSKSARIAITAIMAKPSQYHCTCQP